MDARSGFSYREHHQGTSREAWLEAAGLDLLAAGLSTALFRGRLAWAPVTFDCKESRGEEGVTLFGLVSCLGKLCLWMVLMLYRELPSPTPCQPHMESVAGEKARVCWNSPESQRISKILG